MIQYRVQALKDLKVIFQHFDKYPLISQKQGDYLLFKNVLDLIENKEHLTMEGLRKILAVKASMNNGLSDVLKVAFPGIVPVNRDKIPISVSSINPYWLAGFVEGEGCFLVNIKASKTTSLKKAVQLKFKICQHKRDEQLLINIVDFLGFGRIYKVNEAGIEILVTKFTDIINLLTLFKEYPLQGAKSKDWLDFCTIVELMQNKAHLSASGLDQICKIKAGMNTGRELL
uniref:LAGLIDADG endonuclease n=1 Tax=Bipolaris cookei TaxID=74410 RepID=A0A2H4NRQ3_9PLEO|nr:LAGLIDADG endonuclease [Bipolaris cookei]ATV95717.1 LAGLIDADG endonuclease [Bipolaris cookei]